MGGEFEQLTMSSERQDFALIVPAVLAIMNYLHGTINKEAPSIPGEIGDRCLSGCRGCPGRAAHRLGQSPSTTPPKRPAGKPTSTSCMKLRTITVNGSLQFTKQGRYDLWPALFRAS